MPELPEVETIKRFLERMIIGQKITKIEILSAKQFQGDPKKVTGQIIKNLERRAKILIWHLSNDDKLLFHLKLTGQIVYLPSNAKGKITLGHPIPYAGGDIQPGKPARSTRIIIKLEKGEIFFNDLRKFGWIKIVKNLKELDHLGIEPLSKEFNEKKLAEILSSSRRAVKLVLMDQNKIAGIGNIYANDSLWLAKIDPRKPANQVKRTRDLYQAIVKVLKEAILLQGASDNSYIKPNAEKGHYQDHFKTYQQDGKVCPRCKKAKIKRIKIGNRGTFFCPNCQK